MDLGWAAVLQAVTIAISTVVVRVLAHKDKEDVKQNTSTPSDVLEVKNEVRALRSEFEILRDAYFKDRPKSAIDNRGPTQLKGK